MGGGPGAELIAERRQAARQAEQLIREAEHASLRICELCGAPGASCQRGGWYKTVCREHAREHGYEYVQGSIEIRDAWGEEDNPLPDALEDIADAEAVIALFEERDPEARAQLLDVTFYRRSKETGPIRLGQEFVERIADWTAQRHSPQAASWGVDDRCMIEFSYLDEDSEQRLNAALSARGLADLVEERNRSL